MAQGLNGSRPAGSRTGAAAAARYVIGLGWSLATGLAGGWLMLSPWAVGGQGPGDWSSPTRAEFWTGAALAVLALAGVALVALEALGGPTLAGKPKPAAAAEPVDDVELERALIRLADAVAADLEAPRPPQPQPQPQPPPPATQPAAWPARPPEEGQP